MNTISQPASFPMSLRGLFNEEHTNFETYRTSPHVRQLIEGPHQTDEVESVWSKIAGIKLTAQPEIPKTRPENRDDAHKTEPHLNVEPVKSHRKRSQSAADGLRVRGSPHHFQFPGPAASSKALFSDIKSEPRNIGSFSASLTGHQSTYSLDTSIRRPTTTHIGAPPIITRTRSATALPEDTPSTHVEWRRPSEVFQPIVKSVVDKDMGKASEVLLHLGTPGLKDVLKVYFLVYFMIMQGEDYRIRRSQRCPQSIN